MANFSKNYNVDTLEFMSFKIPVELGGKMVKVSDSDKNKLFRVCKE